MGGSSSRQHDQDSSAGFYCSSCCCFVWHCWASSWLWCRTCWLCCPSCCPCPPCCPCCPCPPWIWYFQCCQHLGIHGAAPAAIPAVHGAYAGAGRYVANSAGVVHVAK